MKFCPVCKTSYDEEVLRFCTKDGTPLVEDAQPNFTAMPSREDLGEETVIRRKTPPPQIPSTAQPLPDFDEPERISSPRIVIPMTDDPVVEEEISPPRREGVRTMTTESIRRQPPPRESNTAMVVALTVLGTILVLGIGGGIVWFLGNQNSDANQNTNYNTNLNSIDYNINANLGVDNSLANFNASISSGNNSNSNANGNSSLNANANSKTPTPTRTPTATPTPDDDANTNRSTNANINLPPSPSVTGTPFPKPSVRPSAAPPSPRPSPPSNEPANRPAVNAGILNSRAVNLPKPAYPSAAKQSRANGQVAVQVSLDEAGNVTSARATSGNPLLRQSAEAAARQSKFTPIRLNNQPVTANGVVLYNFVND